MEIVKNLTNQKLEYALVGRLDTSTAPQLEAAVRADVEGITELVFDFEKLEYISSAGLRVLLFAQKLMNTKGTMKICHVSDDVMEVLEITGFTDILTIA